MNEAGHRLDEEETKWFVGIMRTNFGVESHILSRIAPFFSIDGLSYLSSMCIHKLNFSCTYYLANEIMTA